MRKQPQVKSEFSSKLVQFYMNTDHFSKRYGIFNDSYRPSADTVFGT